MNKWPLLMMLALIGIGGLGVWKSAATPKPRGWEYCTVGWEGATYTGRKVPIAGGKFRYEVDGGSAQICFEESSGCRSEAVRATFEAIGGDMGSVYWDPYFAQAQQLAVVKALAKLGSEGWELVGSGPDPTVVRPNSSQFSPVSPIRTVLYLKRPTS